MSTSCAKGILYGLLCIGGLGCVAFGLHQQLYSQVVAAGNQSVNQQRFDTQDYERGSQFWFARQDKLVFNQGVLAYRANNLPRAAEFFRQASQHTNSTQLRVQALYNLGMVMLALEEAEGAVELFKEALRLDPLDKDAKFNLERLYRFVLRQESEHGEASLKQAPGAGQQEGQNNDGHGRGSSRSGI